MNEKICFVSLGSYPLLTARNMGIAGGAEVDQVLLARGLTGLGFNICFVTYGYGQATVEHINDIEVIKVYSGENVSRLNLFSKWWQIWKAMKKANADIYFHESGAPGIVALFCYLRRRKFVYCIDSDRAVIKKNVLHDKIYIRIGIRLDIKLADTIIAQSEFQAKMLRKNFGRESILIPPGYPLPGQMPKKAKVPIVLWVARISEVKQPELFLRLARTIPQTKFQMIGGRAARNPELYDQIKKSAVKISNLEFLGFVPFHEVDRYFKQAAIFVNTSNVEGFPATFVQAWATYTPVVSLNVDPIEIISKKKIGFHSKSFQQMVKDVKQLLIDGKLRNEMGKNARKYVEREHDIKMITAKYLKVLEQIGAK